MKRGLLLINLGTPDSPKTPDVRRYLREFLSDERVIDLPAIARYLLLYLVILPFRPKNTAELYQRIWTKQGSPLLVLSQQLRIKLQHALPDVEVALGMRYGNPSIKDALRSLAHCEQLTVLPLYPQYSSAATGSSIEKVLALIGSASTHPHLKIVRDFYNHPAFISALVVLIKPHLNPDSHLLLSYHGIPERQLSKIGCNPVCQTNCPPITFQNSTCYRAQCEVTTRAVQQALGLSDKAVSMAFQSRLGKTPWIKPYTDEVLVNLAQQGIQNLVIACPSFTTDCLETLEEIGIRAQEQWHSLGGGTLRLVPCLNDSPEWVEAIIEIINQAYVLPTINRF